MQHLDYSYNTGLLEHFAGVTGLRVTIRGRKRMPAIEFRIGKLGPLQVSAGVQIEVDLGCEGRSDIVLTEAKVGQPKDFIIRQLFYPYRKWRREIPTKRILPLFFCATEVSGRRLYHFWQYDFEDDAQYLSLHFKRGETFFIEPLKRRLTVEELLRAHLERREEKRVWDVPQADTFERVAEIPLLIEQGFDTSAKVAEHYEFDPRQSSYYRQAAEYLGLARLGEKSHQYELTDLGRDYVRLAADERRKLLAGLLASFPPMRAVLEYSSRASDRGVSKAEIAQLISRHSTIGKTTPTRRAATLLSWLRWLQSAAGTVEVGKTGFSLSP